MSDDDNWHAKDAPVYASALKRFEKFGDPESDIEADRQRIETFLHSMAEEVQFIRFNAENTKQPAQTSITLESGEFGSCVLTTTFNKFLDESGKSLVTAYETVADWSTSADSARLRLSRTISSESVEDVRDVLAQYIAAFHMDVPFLLAGRDRRSL